MAAIVVGLLHDLLTPITSLTNLHAPGHDPVRAPRAALLVMPQKPAVIAQSREEA